MAPPQPHFNGPRPKFARLGWAPLTSESKRKIR
jgi:hypothetical protein